MLRYITLQQILKHTTEDQLRKSSEGLQLSEQYTRTFLTSPTTKFFYS